MSSRQAVLEDSARTLEPLYIAALFVKASPSDIWTGRDAAARLPGSEFHAVTDDGRMVITIERVKKVQTVATIATTTEFSRVLSPTLAFHQLQRSHAIPSSARSGNEPARID